MGRDALRRRSVRQGRTRRERRAACARSLAGALYTRHSWPGRGMEERPPNCPGTPPTWQGSGGGGRRLAAARADRGAEERTHPQRLAVGGRPPHVPLRGIETTPSAPPHTTRSHIAKKNPKKDNAASPASFRTYRCMSGAARRSPRLHLPRGCLGLPSPPPRTSILWDFPHTESCRLYTGRRRPGRVQRVPLSSASTVGCMEAQPIGWTVRRQRGCFGAAGV